MALPFETLTAEDRARDRALSQRRREDWGKEDEVKRFLHGQGGLVARMKEMMEDLLLDLQPEEVAYGNKARTVATLRAAVTELGQEYKKIEMGAKYGLRVAEGVFEKPLEVEGLSADQERRFRALRKKAEEEASRPAKRKVEETMVVPHRQLVLPPQFQQGWMQQTWQYPAPGGGWQQ